MKYCLRVLWLKNAKGEKRACTAILLSLEAREGEGCPGKAAREAPSSLSAFAGCAASVGGDEALLCPALQAAA